MARDGLSNSFAACGLIVHRRWAALRRRQRIDGAGNVGERREILDRANPPDARR
jgi:hypothetical protein